MLGSMHRVRAVFNGEMPDRAPIFELVRNDAVIEHFSGCKLTVENGPEVVYRAYGPAVDATKLTLRLPDSEGTSTLADGRAMRRYRWTTWSEHKQYGDSDAYACAKKKEMESSDPSCWDERRQQSLTKDLALLAQESMKLGEVFPIPRVASPWIMAIHSEVGLEAFSYYLADCPDIIVQLLEHNTVNAVTTAQHFPEGHGIEAGMLGDDIAFKTAPMVNPVWLREHYFPRLARVIDAWHARGIKVVFHSDGNINPILHDLVEAGIDGLNPIEVLAGMDVADIHRRYPHLVLVGGIDVSQLLPFGSPQAVKDAVKRAIDAAQGRIMIGSTTELNDAVPLENYLALREAVLENPY